MRVNINSIQIKKRARKSAGDLHALVDSISKHGIIQPIIINQDYILIAGYRRLQAAKSLGYKTIEARMINTHSTHEGLELEIEENLSRIDFTGRELDEARKRLANLKKHKNPLMRLFYRFIEWVKNLFRRNS